jgi:cytochrome c biogenesis protein CcmG, thiol:disulfide interchange protein DsbE
MTPSMYQYFSTGRLQVQALGIVMALLALGIAAAEQEVTPWTGGPTPSLTLTDHQGTSHTLAAYQGRVVLVNFWATWCEPCREEMPALQQLQNILGKERLVVLAVNYGESSGKVQEFAGHMPVDFPLLLDSNTEVAKAWQVRVLPTSFVLSPDGKIQYSAVGTLDWGAPSMVKRLTALLPP